MKVKLFGHEHKFKVRVEVKNTKSGGYYTRRYFTEDAELQAYLEEAAAGLKAGEHIEVWPVKELMTVYSRKA